MGTTTCQLLAFAKQNATADDEAVRRAAISRSYYCAYHDLAEALHPMFSDQDLKSRENGRPAHAAVARNLRDVGRDFPDRKKAMAHGAEARNLWHNYNAILRSRSIADYALEATAGVTAQEAILHLGRVDRLRKLAKKLAA